MVIILSAAWLQVNNVMIAVNPSVENLNNASMFWGQRHLTNTFADIAFCLPIMCHEAFFRFTTYYQCFIESICSMVYVEKHQVENKYLMSRYMHWVNCERLIW